MPTTLDDVREFLRHALADELKIVNEVIKSRWKHLQRETSLRFVQGDGVYFVKGKRSPKVIRGTVVGADGKWVYVMEAGRPPSSSGYHWKVSPTLLRRYK